MAKRPKTPKSPYRGKRPEESIVLLKKELRRRGMTDAEIEATLRKKRRRKVLEFNIVKARHLMPTAVNSPLRKTKAEAPKPRPRESRPRYGDELCTVRFAADRLKLHPKTVQRLIREGRLRATRIGKSYRIRRADLDAFSGVPAPAEATAQEAWVTSIVDIPDIAPELAQKCARTIPAALNTRLGDGASLRAEVVYEPERSHLKIVLMGPPDDTAKLLSFIRVWLEQLRP